MSTRYDDAYIIKDINGNDIVVPRAFFRYKEIDDNIIHIAKDNESLWEIATQYYSDVLQNPSLHYWIIADYQPEPILDPTQTMVQGRTIYVPSIRTIETLINNPDRDPEYERF